MSDSRVELLAFRLLRRHARKGSQQGALDRPGGIRFAVRHQLGDTEIQQLYRASERQQDIGRFQVAVKNASGMRLFECAGYLQSRARRFLRAHRPAERCPFDVLQHQVSGTYVINVANVRVVQRRDGARLLLKPRAVFPLEALQGHRPVEPRVRRLPHLTHAAGANAGHQLIWSQLVTHRKRHAAEFA